MESKNRRITKLLMNKSMLFEKSIYEKDKMAGEYNKLKQEYEELLRINEEITNNLIKLEENLKKKR